MHPSEDRSSACAASWAVPTSPLHQSQSASRHSHTQSRNRDQHSPVLPPWLHHSHPAYLYEFQHHFLPQVKPPVPPPKDPEYLEALRALREAGSPSHLHGGVISSGEHGGIAHAKQQQQHQQQRESPRSTTGKSASTTGGKKERKGLEKLRAANRAFLSKLQSVKLWPSSKHASSIATASDPLPMQHQRQPHQQPKKKEDKSAKEQDKKKRRSFFSSLNSKRTKRPDANTNVSLPASTTPAVPVVVTPAPHQDDHIVASPVLLPAQQQQQQQYHQMPSTTTLHLLAAGAAAGTGGKVSEAGATATTTTAPSSTTSEDASHPSKPVSPYDHAQKSTTSTATHASPTHTSPPTPLFTLVTGPEHWYHLALQLESSNLLAHQLQAKQLFKRSAESGFAPAQFKLGICYELGLVHFAMDPSQSFFWYQQAALQGHADAELAISGWYLTGHSQGLGQSDALAYEWAHKAATRAWSKAEYTLGHYHEVGIGVAPDLDLAKQWYLKAASRGNERALLRLLVGHVGLEVDYAHLKDALLALNQANPYLVHQLAQFHELREYGLVPDEETAFELYAASAQADYAPAQYRLGACYEFGILGCPQDPVQAVEWYRRGADNGHVEALLALAGFFLDGSAGPAAPQSDEEAFRYVRTAALRGVPKAEYIAGFFLEYGLGSPRHVEQAKQWYRLACAKGVESAEKRLRVLEREGSSNSSSNSSR